MFSAALIEKAQDMDFPATVDAHVRGRIVVDVNR
jgi:hypothetical protein